MGEFKNLEGETVFISGQSPKLLVKDETLNDSDKVFTAPAGQVWDIFWILVRLTTTATAGARRMVVEFRDPVAVAVFAQVAFNTQAASSGPETYKWLPGTDRPTEDVATAHIMPLPARALLPGGFDIRVAEKNVIAPAGDDMTVYIMGQEYPA